MADPLVRLDPTRAVVQPGGQTRVDVTITNAGTVVEGYQLLVLGATAPWATVQPGEISVYPQQEAKATVVFSPPQGPGAPGGTQPFGVLARSTLDPTVSAAAEGDVEVGEVVGLQAKLIPVTSAGRWRGRHVLQVTNLGNTPETLRFTASDPDAALGYYLQPEVVELPVQGQATVRISVRTKHPFLRGAPVKLPFQVVGERLDAPAPGAAPPPTGAAAFGDPSRPVVDGALSQRPILSRTFLTLATLLLAGVVGLGAYLLFKPETPEEALAGRGAPGKPTLTATATGPTTIGLAWKSIDLIDGYTLLKIDPTTGAPNGQQTVDRLLQATEVTGLAPATAYCYKLTAIRGGVSGELSDQACATTGPAPASPSPSPSPPASSSAAPASSSAPATPPTTPTPGVTPGDPLTDPIMKQRWITVLLRRPVDLTDPADQANAQQSVQDFRDFGLDAKLLRTGTYPRLVYDGPSPTTAATPGPEEWLVYLGPLADPAAAVADCPTIQHDTGTDTCLAAQPDPPQ